MKKYIVWLLVALVLLHPLQADTLDIKSIYSSQIMVQTNEVLEQLAKEYEEIAELVIIGYSTTQNTEIKALKLGKGEKSILINGTHHGREALTTVLLLNQIQYLGEKYKQGSSIQGEDVRTVLNTVSIYFVPLLNPDGAEIALSSQPNWKANGRGVDLNRNYPTPHAKLVTKPLPGASEYAGTSPFSELETQALRDLCMAQNFEGAIAYHSAGEVIYWWYHQTGKLYKTSLAIAQKLSRETGYGLVPISESKGGLGFTDWFIQTFHKPAYTLEIGKTVNGKPLDFQEYNEIWEENKEIPFLLAVEVLNLNTVENQVELGEKTIQGKNILGRSLVPVKAVCEAIGVSYRYISEEKAIELVGEEWLLYFRKGEKTAKYNDEIIDLVMPACIIEGEMYIPLRTILENINLE